jgi:hypothetical protein
LSRIDLHIHTSRSDGAGTVEEVLASAGARPELLAIAITDHNEIKGAHEAVKKAPEYNVQVIVGEEISTLGGHILGLYLKSLIEPGLTPEETIRRIHGQGGIAVIPHVFPHYRGIGREILETLLSSPNWRDRPDAIEVRNGFPPQLVFTPQIRKLNRKLWHLPEVGGSDSHHPNSIGACWTEFEGESLEDFREALKRGRTSAAGGGWSVLEMARATFKDAGRHLRRRFRDH